MKNNSKNSLIFVALLAISVVTIIAYYPGMSAGFYFDDKPNFSQHPALQWTEISTDALQQTLAEAWAKTRPVANISLSITHVYAGLDPAPYHWTNLLIHLAVGLALFWVIRSLQFYHAENRGHAWLATLAVFLFLVHPLNIQAVTFVIQRMTSMATLFFLLAFGSYLAARYNDARARKYMWFALATAFFLLSIGSKEIGYLLLPVLLLYEFCFNRTEWRTRLWETHSSLQRVVLFVGGGVLVIIVAWAAWQLGSGSIYWHETMPKRDYSGFERVLTQGRVQFFYLSLLLWPAPSRLNLDHDFVVSRALLDPASTLLAIFGWLAIILFAIRNLSTRPRLAFPILAYLLLHSMESAPINLELVFEHRMYLPTTMLAVLLAMNPIPWMQSDRQASYIMIMGIGLLLSYATYQRNTVWGDPIAFLQDTAQKSPNKFRPHYNLGTELGIQGRIQQSRIALERAVALEPEHAQAHNQLGNVYMLMQLLERAEKHYRLAVKYDSEYAMALYNLSLILASQQRYEEQKEVLRQFVEHAPPNLEKQKQWAITYLSRPNNQ
jgi:hypothetical protein